MTWLHAAARRPILWVLAIALLAGLFVFRDYGLTWDEPLFYKYADALGYAYTPANWLSGHFDLNQSYGPSGDDHKNRGPAYLLLAREPVYLLAQFGVETAAAWHLINFLTFLVGIYFVYRLCAMFTQERAAVAASALFGLQPLLWGHAFINPKDMPFLVFFTGSVWLGFRMVDRVLAAPPESWLKTARHIVLPAVMLGVASGNRVLGPLAGLLVAVYFLIRIPAWRTVPWILLYGLLSAVIMLASWPYLWEAPARFLQVFQFMSDNPTVLPVLFADHVYHAYDLPGRYLPFFLTFTLTESVWPLFVLGLVALARKVRAGFAGAAQALLILLWLVVPVVYVVARRPPEYDGMRHFLFLLPPVFVIGAIGIDVLFEKINKPLINLVLGAVILTPGAIGIVQLHPYEYAYYNSAVGGTGGVFRHFETDYWLTCYKEAVQEFNISARDPVKLYVHREPAVAQPYAAWNVSVLDERGAVRDIAPGDYILVNTRTNEDRQTFRDAPIVLSVGRAGATFCVIKRIP
jgi:hypothetical protein